MSDPSTIPTRTTTTIATNDADAPAAGSWNDQIIAEFRANAGYVSWSSEEDFAAGRPVPPRIPGFDERGMPLILVHHIGAKSGRERINPCSTSRSARTGLSSERTAAVRAIRSGTTT